MTQENILDISEDLQKKQKNFPTEKIGKIAMFCNIAFFGFAAFWPIFSTEESVPLVKNIVVGLYIAVLVVYGIWMFGRYRHGMEDVRFRQPEYKEIIEQIKKAKNEIKIIVYHGETLLDAIRKEIIEAINKKNSTVTVKLLIAKKKSILLEEVWELEKKDGSIRMDEARKYIKEIEDKTITNPHRFDYLEYNTQARYSIIIVDNKWAWWTPYHPGRRVEETPSIVLTKKGGDSIILDCIDHFERLWVKLDQERRCEWRKKNKQCSEKTEQTVERVKRANT